MKELSKRDWLFACRIRHDRDAVRCPILAVSDGVTTAGCSVSGTPSFASVLNYRSKYANGVRTGPTARAQPEVKVRLIIRWAF